MLCFLFTRRLPKRVKSFFTDGVSLWYYFFISFHYWRYISSFFCVSFRLPFALTPPVSLLLLCGGLTCHYCYCVVVSGDVASPRRGQVKTSLHLWAWNHHLQQRPQGGLAAVQADPHREGQSKAVHILLLSRNRHTLLFSNRWENCFVRVVK